MFSLARWTQIRVLGGPAFDLPRDVLHAAIFVCRFILHDVRSHENGIESLRSVPAPASGRIHVAKSISPSRSWDDVAAQWVPVDLPLQGLLHASEKAWHRNYAHSSSSVGNALRFQSWAQCVWMLLTFHNWSRIYHCRDGRTFFWSFKWKQIAAFCRVQSAATQIQMPYFVWCRDSGVKVCKGCQGWTPS